QIENPQTVQLVLDVRRDGVVGALGHQLDAQPRSHVRIDDVRDGGRDENVRFLDDQLAAVGAAKTRSGCVRRAGGGDTQGVHVAGIFDDRPSRGAQAQQSGNV